MTPLQLPAPFTDVAPSASLDRGRRSISWTLMDPGELHRNTYRMAWIEVTERNSWRGDPLWLHASRRRHDGWTREPFTDKARDALHAEIVPRLARCFGDVWIGLHRSRTTSSGDMTRTGLAIAEWCRQVDELADLHAAGLLDFRPVDTPTTRANFERCGIGVRVWTGHRGTDTEDAVAGAYLDGQHVGWMLRTGSIAPRIDPLGDHR